MRGKKKCFRDIFIYKLVLMAPENLYIYKGMYLLRKLMLWFAK